MNNPNISLTLAECRQKLKEDYLDLVRDLLDETYAFVSHINLLRVFEASRFSIHVLQEVDLLECLAKANSDRLFIKHALTSRRGRGRPCGELVRKLTSPDEFVELNERFDAIELFFRNISHAEGFEINWNEYIHTEHDSLSFPVISIRGCLTDSEDDSEYIDEVHRLYSTMVKVLDRNDEHDSIKDICFRIDGYKGNLIANPKFSFDADKHQWYFVDPCEAGISDKNNAFSSLLELNPAK